MTDKQLIQNYLSGDDISSFNQLVKRWEKPLFNFIYRYIGDMEIAKDIAQKVFIKIYQNLRKLKEPDKFSSWCYSIASNLCKDEIKHQKRKNSIFIESIDDKNENTYPIPKEPLNNPDNFVNQLQLQQLLNQALQSIPEEQRVVIIMKEYQGLKFIEIAEVLGEPINTVKSRMYYGLNALKKVFDLWQINKEVLQYEM